MRLFVAIDLPMTIKEHLSELINNLTFARTASSMKLHLTLFFLGEVNTELIPKIIDALQTLTAPPITVRLQGVGCFPSPSRARVLWAGIEPQEALVNLKKQIDLCLGRMGFVAEARRFHPHITLCRIKIPHSKEIHNFLRKYHRFESQKFTLSDFALFSSRLTPSGSHYTQLQAFRLQGRA